MRCHLRKAAKKGSPRILDSPLILEQQLRKLVRCRRVGGITVRIYETLTGHVAVDQDSYVLAIVSRNESTGTQQALDTVTIHAERMLGFRRPQLAAV